MRTSPLRSCAPPTRRTRRLSSTPKTSCIAGETATSFPKRATELSLRPDDELGGGKSAFRGDHAVVLFGRTLLGALACSMAFTPRLREDEYGLETITRIVVQALN